MALLSSLRARLEHGPLVYRSSASHTHHRHYTLVPDSYTKTYIDGSTQTHAETNYNYKNASAGLCGARGRSHAQFKYNVHVIAN